MTVGNQLRIREPTADLLDWCKKNMVLANPDYAKKVRMHLWLGNTPQKLYLMQWDGDTLVLPYGCLNTVLRLGECEVINDLPTPKEVDFGCSVPLYDYQETAKEAMLKAYYGILQSPAGSGKTQIGIALAAALGRKTLWLTHTSDLLRQSKNRAEQYMSPSLTGTITEGRVQIGKVITFATVQTMCNLDLGRYRDVWDCIIVDECFPAGTKIQTPHGTVPIQFVRPGELVLTRNEFSGKLEFCEVEELQVRSAKRLLKITSSYGQTVICTPNHPFYTRNGYRKAADLKYGDEVYILREGVRPVDMEPYPTIRNSKGRTLSVLFQRMFRKRKSSALCLDGRPERNFSEIYERNQSQIRFRENEEEQPDVQRRNPSESLTNPESNKASSTNSRWEWSRLDNSARAFNRESFRVSPNVRVCCTDQVEKSRLSDTLQNRHCHSPAENRNRSRWRLSWFQKSSERRYEKDGIFEWVRVESVEILKPRSDGTFGDLCPGNCVYNLAVKHNHNYFANGFAVHNCHRVAGTPTSVTQFSKVLNSLAARHKYGLSATVHRADGMIAATYALLGQIAYQVPDAAVAEKVMTVSVLPRPTHQGLSREFLDTDGTIIYAKLVNFLADRYDRNELIAADLVENRDHYNLILSDRLSHLEYLMKHLPHDLRDQAVMVDGKMTSKKAKAMREQAIEDMRQGRKRYLFATYSLAREGLDIPRLDRLYLTTPQKDYAVITQSVGRIARTFEGKSEPICYDYVDDGIQYLIKSYKKRCTSYRKLGCKFL